MVYVYPESKRKLTKGLRSSIEPKDKQKDLPYSSQMNKYLFFMYKKNLPVLTGRVAGSYQ